MTDQDPVATVAGTAHVMHAYDRLTEAGYTTGHGDTRGINRAGFDTLADLLTVATFQLGSGQSRNERVAGAACRAAMSALGETFAESDGTDTLKLLAEATREART